MKPCQCREPHESRKIVLTGGPGAGKTAVLELIRQSFCEHIALIPESAGILFGGGFPRGSHLASQQAVQKAIFYVQRELETAMMAENAAILICDRGTVDGAAYWPGPGDFWDSLDTTLEEQLQNYNAVIHLRTPYRGYNHQNPLRIESAREAHAIDTRIAEAWATHPHRYIVNATQDFLTKATRTIDILRAELPACCREQIIPAIGQNG